MNKIINSFLIFILFFNTLFFSVNAFPKTFADSVVGPRDRIRTYDQIKFNYSKDSGFSCRPSGLRFLGFEEKSAEDIKNEEKSWTDKVEKAIKDIINAKEEITWDIISNVFLMPVLCISMLRSFYSANNSSDSSMVGSLGIMLSLILTKSLQEIEDMFLPDDDYNLDPTNPYCAPVLILNLIFCTAMAFVSKLKSVKLQTRLLIILGTSATLYAARFIDGIVQYSKAYKVFNNLSLCGDNWNNYGNFYLKDALDANSGSGSTSYTGTVPQKVEIKFIEQNFPIRGAFPGSREYLLDECFKEKNLDKCKDLFGNSIKNLKESDIDSLTTVIYKQYREFLYGGVEYAYNGCVDPRKERRNYLGTSNKSSQLYYFKGNETANFACERFLTELTDEYRTAYKCCLEASTKLICISNKENGNDTYKMCTIYDKAGECKIKTDIKDEDIKSSEIPDCSKIKNIIKGNDSAVSDKDVEEIYSKICDEDGKVRPSFTESTSTEVDNDKGNIKFKITASVHGEENKYCVETFNLCPYNFRLLGGSENRGKEFSPSFDIGFDVRRENGVWVENTSNTKSQEYNKNNNCVFDEEGNRNCQGVCAAKSDSNKVIYLDCYNQPSNFCQLNRHCVTVATVKEREEIRASPYTDKSCINSVGSSHNFNEYSTLVARSNNLKLLTAPIVECTVETFKNILLNKAGHTRCNDATEISLDDETCKSGAVYIKGQDLDETQYPSSFKILKKYFMNIVKALLVLAIVIYGYQILLMKKGLSAEEIMKFILTIIFVSYFSLSNNWVSPVFNAVYNTYTNITMLSLKIINTDDDFNYTNPKYSGCYFLKSNFINNNYKEYKDRKYIALFDTLDCKISRYFGYYTNAASNPPILSILIAGIFTFGIGLILMLPFLFIFISILYLIIEIAFAFILSSLTITLLLFLSPIFIPLYLFDKTKDKVIAWLKTILRNIFTPLFLIISLFLFFEIFDKYFIGEAIFYGEKEPIRNVYCGKICKLSDTLFYYITGTKDSQITKEKKACESENNGKFIDLKNKSLICILGNSNKTTNSHFTVLNLIIEDFKGLPGIALQIDGFFSCFLDMIFLLILIFIYNKLLPNIADLSDKIFGTGTGGGVVNGKLFGSLKEVLNSVAKVGTNVANKTKNADKAVINFLSNKNDKNKDKKAVRGPVSNSQSKSQEENKDSKDKDKDKDKEENKSRTAEI